MSKRSGCGAAPRSTYVAAPTPQKGHSTSTAPLHHITYTAPRPRIWQSFVGSPRREGHVEVAPAIQHRCLTSEWEDARNIPSDWRLGSGHADCSVVYTLTSPRFVNSADSFGCACLALTTMRFLSKGKPIFFEIFRDKTESLLCNILCRKLRQRQQGVDLLQVLQ